VNYLGHYVYNHEICGLPAEPYFVLGVALPDLWPRFSRTRRIRWSQVRAAAAGELRAAQLRAGLLNHAATDRRFHTLPAFLEWQEEVGSRAGRGAVHPTVRDFLTHLAIELALDHLLVREDAGRAEDFYDRVAGCDPLLVERSLHVLAGVNAGGLGREIEAFVRRRFLARFAERQVPVAVMGFVLGLAGARSAAPAWLLGELFAAAAGLVQPARIWSEMRARGGSPAPVAPSEAPGGRE